MKRALGLLRIALVAALAASGHIAMVSAQPDAEMTALRDDL